jgi:hypothetical protein
MPALIALAMTLSLGPAASAQTQESRGNDSDVTRGELASFDRFMDDHPEIAEQLRKDPSLVKNKEFVENHPALEEYIEQHPEVREEISENPSGFMHQEQRFDRRADHAERPDDDVTRRELGSFDRFMDSHPEIAEQLRRDPSLVKNKEFVENHPALEEYIEQHPEVREEISENPSGFMHQEQRFDQRQDWRNDHRDHDFDRAEVEGFGHFLGDHSEVASQLSRNPSLANNEEFVENHPDLQQYLKEHPGAQKQLTSNPQNFIQSAQQFTNSTAAPKTPILNPQPKPQK